MVRGPEVIIPPPFRVAEFLEYVERVSVVADVEEE